MKLGVLCSGKLGYSLLRYLSGRYDIDFVCTDFESKAIIEYCKENNVALFIGNPRQGKITGFISGRTIDVLISVNYLFIVDGDLIRLPGRIAFNIHGSLLPKFRGRTPHVWAIINNESMAGVTAHLIDHGCDTGDVIEQVAIPIEPDDTGAKLLEKYERAYVPIITSVLEKVASNRLSLVPQDNSKATFYGKRTPNDGLIDWSWQKQRIYNWVRAQSYPYPGAYTYFGNVKIVIDEVKFSDLGYNWSDENGKIIFTNPLTVKSPNGAIEITRLREPNVEFVLNERFTDRII